MNTKTHKWVRHFVFIAGAVVILFSAFESYRYLWSRTFIIIDGKEILLHRRLATAESITSALLEKGITLGGKDLIIPPATRGFWKKNIVRVIRVEEKISTEEDTPEFKVLWKKKNLRNLRPVELQKGILRRTIKKVKQVYRDGIEYEKQPLNQRKITKTIYRLALLDSEGREEKTYDLYRCKKLKMIATAYYPGDPLAWRDGTVTFLGQKMQRGIVAVDPRIIPLRTRVYVPGYGYGFAGDTGSAIKNMRIDLGVNNAHEEKEWMHRRVTVYILEKSPTW
ncbi:MAG: hypothetical protein A2219_02495 [Elusimicrobia bacterium RIFOXYA2_FULL_50_26]|nr:MAG: hypothetical protein A2219_02495 [Elusimicrobia bacterium RIFOXYA2_FULL_50_26]